MVPFRFRAAGALDFRRKQEDEARVVFARAEAVEREAAVRLGHAEESVKVEGERLEAVQRAGATAGLINWHRGWIANRRVDADACRRVRETAAEALEREALALREAYRRRRTLERLRERTLRKYELDVKREDTRSMNELAGLRHVARAAESRRTE
jgi:flagellar export protein FliJ